ncbi:Cleavage/polyadenylation specificity factor subunit 5 [Piptocephalis cylindrospora]|uniref:Cleavage and polyadenylation specificity factor subunit 5 n=1 Tax=Piptocephalis cylindrospora TaxID=1907219 RepID=A0A4P9Y7I8_9FUNG|nr:Cleavage/polyadenylation specificity factor subunit 5 [Piptocephalis cylindrospora]|eukprot:RKP14221.1 Cleavage/polyadenylation specificity factor subunit 5 [Piptocephalis cylindrospora]
MNTASVYPLANYTFGTKEAQPEEDTSVTARMDRLEKDFSVNGMRRSVDAVLVVHDHGHPHVLMFQIAAQFYKLPGGYIKKEDEADDEATAVKKILTKQLSAEHLSATDGAIDPDWGLEGCLSTWWRPNFETFMYPYVPPHVSHPKERRQVWLMRLPPRKSLVVPQNMRLVAVPLIELYDNTSRYGAQLSALPHAMSNWSFTLLRNPTVKGDESEEGKEEDIMGATNQPSITGSA